MKNRIIFVSYMKEKRSAWFSIETPSDEGGLSTIDYLNSYRMHSYDR